MEFKIVNLDRNTENDVVTTVHYTVTKTDGEALGSSYGTVGVEAGDTVIPFEELTEDTVIEWVESKLDLVKLEANLDAQIQEQKTPKVASGLPWGTPVL
jgi:Tfp pilus assembly protein PilP